MPLLRFRACVRRVRSVRGRLPPSPTLVPPADGIGRGVIAVVFGPRKGGRGCALGREIDVLVFGPRLLRRVVPYFGLRRGKAAGEHKNVQKGTFSNSAHARKYAICARVTPNTSLPWGTRRRIGQGSSGSFGRRVDGSELVPTAFGKGICSVSIQNGLRMFEL